MQGVSYFYALYKKMLQFLKVESCHFSTRSLDSPYTEHGTPHFHAEYHLNRLPHECINT